MNKPSTPAAGNRPDTDPVSATAQSQPLVQLEPPSAGIAETSSPADLVSWGLQKFADQSIVMTTSYGMEGCALMDLCSKAIEKPRLSLD